MPEISTQVAVAMIRAQAPSGPTRLYTQYARAAGTFLERWQQRLVPAWIAATLECRCRRTDSCPRGLWCTSAALALGLVPLASSAQDPPVASVEALTLYTARLTTVNAWHDIPTDPGRTDFANAYLAVAALSKTFERYRDGALSLFGEAQVGYNFGDQSHWEFNLAAGPRWHRFPWSDTVVTSAAFALGLSWASEVPEVEVALEKTSEQLLVYWLMELTFGPPGARWAVSLRLHHRSTGFGLFADEGGMNALGAGLRVAF